MRVRTSIVLAVAALLASACGSGSEQSAIPSISSTVPVTTSPGVAEAPPSLPDIEDEPSWKPTVDPIYEVTVATDLVYGQGEVAGGDTFDDLLLDLYVPDVEGQDRFPLVVTIHGGGFNGGSKAATAFVSDQFAQRGYIAASINYRLSGDDPVPSSRMQPVYDEIGGVDADARARAVVAALDDTMTALDFLHARSDVESSQTVLWGSSAGAITAVFVGYAMDDFGIDSPPVSAVISNSGGFIGDVRSAETFIEDDGSEGPIFMTHATGDTVVAFKLAQDIVDRAEAVGHPYEQYFADAVSHGIPGGLFRTEFSPGVSVFQAQVDWLDSFLVGVADTTEP